jgi:hypothetical protein
VTRAIKLGLLIGLMAASVAILTACGGSVDGPAPLPVSFSVAHPMTTCLWKGPFGTAAGEINSAYPDGGASYWSAVFTVPAGDRVFLKGQYPYARYMSFNTYRPDNTAASALHDEQIAADAGSSNPFTVGAARYAANRNYALEVTPTAAAGTAAPNTLYANAGYGQAISVIFRVYAADNGADETGGVGLPDLQVQRADGSILTGAQACSELSASQTPIQPPLVGAALYASLRDQAGKPAGFPALNPAGWTASYNTPYWLNCTFNGVCGGTPVRQVGFFANLDNAYVTAQISRAFGSVVVVQGRLPTTPRTFSNAGTMSSGQLRYWSMCTNEFYTQKATSCLYDEQVPVDSNGNYTIVISRTADRPSNATAACNRGFMAWSDAGDGAGHTDDGMLIMRNMLPAETFANAIQNTKVPGDEASVIGPYLPTITYTTTAAYQAQGCK